jgi:hypothetical protein
MSGKRINYSLRGEINYWKFNFHIQFNNNWDLPKHLNDTKYNARCMAALSNFDPEYIWKLPKTSNKIEPGKIYKKIYEKIT